MLRVKAQLLYFLILLLNNLKVETVGDKYMAVSGLPEYEVAHAKHICRLALEMMDLSQTVTVDGEPVVREVVYGLYSALNFSLVSSCSLP